jgi:quercetin dioxygenase-like cupin family protein
MRVSGWKVRNVVAAATFLAPGLVIANDSSVSAPTEGKVVSEVLLQTTKSWDGETYKPYPKGQPQLSVLRIYIPPHTSLPWHSHPVINAAYVLTGELTLEKKSDGKKLHLKTGDVLPEMVNELHLGYTEDQSALLLVFYAGVEGTPITVVEHKSAPIPPVHSAERQN